MKHFPVKTTDWHMGGRQSQQHTRERVSIGSWKVLRCPICRYKGNAEVLTTRDYNQGVCHGPCREFEYGVCPECGCMWLLSVPDDLGDYYGSSYYSFSLRGKGLTHLLMQRRDIYELAHRGIAGKVLHGLIPRPAYGLIGEYVGKDEAILDVGCGDGYLLFLLGRLGYTNLSGCDRFLPSSCIRGMGTARLVRGTVGQCVGMYDLIMFHHSFEHMENPREVIQEACQKLRIGGTLILSLPLAASNAFREYGRYWVQLDAPRHIFLHSRRSLAILAGEVGLVEERVIYDSSAFQYVGSIQYKKGLDGDARRSLPGMLEYALLAMLKYSRKARKDNNNQEGDQATFVFRKYKDIH